MKAFGFMELTSTTQCEYKELSSFISSYSCKHIVIYDLIIHYSRFEKKHLKQFIWILKNLRIHLIRKTKKN